MKKAFLKAYAAKLKSEGAPGRVTIKEAEASVVATMTAVAHKVAPSYVFGYHDVEDMVQQALLEGLEAIEEGRYDIERPLENFMHVHMNNRLFNYKRDNFNRSEAPCKCCDPYDPPPEPCKKWLAWSKRNKTKQNIARPLDVNSVAEPTHTNTDSVFSEVASREVMSMIDRYLGADLRSDFLRMRAGVAVPKTRKIRIREAVSEALDGRV